MNTEYNFKNRNDSIQEDRLRYKRTLEDEIDWKIIDQLHNATLNFSTKSLEIKKMFLVFIGILIPAILKLSNDTMNWSIVIIMYLSILSFWLIDSYTYYYQEKLRGLMDNRFINISKRNERELIIKENIKSGFTIEPNRVKKVSKVKSIFNASHLIYFIMLILNIIFHLLYWKGFF
ncbi:hypothetical protein SAMN05720606_112178 [Paenibacillus polysaccharolyticus]|uniref:Uncharacterized protein n=1 Tax=Paenibacillus polysaccharolyticus TaxID=582692 RepID=A0A1G5JYY2_9BACL|nr:hypothetical protein [Paenibacillus polysaccharolyticus]SCY93526.1 hypothetical protein SAMN05720606_112178 [Paenibacillus polysaccharolyticus]